MADKPIVRIEVDDTRFKRFQAEFERYKKSLTEQQGKWVAASKGVEKFADNFRKAISANVQPLVTIAKTTASIASNIERATMNLMKWAGITSIISGLLGIGSLFGIDRLANAASGMRRSAGGIGVSAAQQRAFGINYGRYFDTENVLTNVANAKSDLSKRWAFGALGIQNVDQRDPAEIAAEMAIKAKALFERTGMTQQGAQANGLLEFYSMEDLRRLHNTSNADLGRSRQGYERDRNTLGLDDPTLKKWQEFTIVLERAGTKIEAIFINKLSALAGPLGHLSESFTKVVDAFASSPKIKEWIDLAGKGLEALAKWIGSDQFGKDVESFANGLAKLTEALWGAIKWIYNKLGLGDPDKAAPAGAAGGTGGATLEGNGKVKVQPGYKPPEGWSLSPNGDLVPNWMLRWFSIDPATANTAKPENVSPYTSDLFRSPGAGRAGYSPASTGSNDNTPAGSANQFSDLEHKAGLPPGVLWNVYGAESSYGRDPSTSKAGAQGPFQFIPSTAAQYGLTNPQDTMQSADAAARYLHDLVQQFGDVRKALAAYNWGPGNLQADIRAHGADWERYLPQETSDYLRKTTRGLEGVASAGNSRVLITIANNTGGNAIVSTQQLAV